MCIAALVLIFQPFSLSGFTIGAGLVVLAGLAVNLIPLCRPGVDQRAVIKAAANVVVILLVVVAVAIGSAELYALYLNAQR